MPPFGSGNETAARADLYHRHMKSVALVAALAFQLVALPGCGSAPTDAGSAATRADAAAPTPQPFERPGLHNVVPMSPNVYSGSVPEGDQGFASLASMGVRTVISVDGAKPGVERAGVYGLRYVHIPIQYSGIDRDAALQLAAAVRDLPGPIYVHCHHGKHRGPAAACLALVEAGAITPEHGVELMRLAGTSKQYDGLYEAVSNAKPVPESATRGMAATLPAIAPVPGFTAAMSGLEHASEHLKLIQSAGWQAPSDHPDLVPASEAGMLHDYFRAANADDENNANDDFAGWMQLSLEQSRTLESAIDAGDHVAASSALRVVLQACTDCHATYRNPGRTW